MSGSRFRDGVLAALPLTPAPVLFGASFGLERGSESVRAALAEDLRALQLDDAEYAGVVRAFVTLEQAA